MKDFGPISIIAILREFLEPWIWPIAIFVALVLFVYVVGLLRKGSFASVIRRGFFPAAVVAALFAIFMFAAVPTLTESAWSRVAGLVDILFIALIALGYGAAMFVLALPVAALLRGQAPS
jgi:hypothetical protein